MDSDRLYAVSSKLTDYTQSPSLRHIRDPRNIQKLAREIVQSLDRASSIWQKWDGPREQLAKAAAPCWIPIEDLQAFLNRLPGPALTATDVAQRLRAFWEEPWEHYPNDELKPSCLALYEAEKAQGTELRAIALQEHIEASEERLRQERDVEYRRLRDEDRVRREQRYLAGADCGWTQLTNSEDFFCRRNGRSFRVSRSKDNRWDLFRAELPNKTDVLIGTYLGRREAGKTVQKIAYEPEPRW
ncbi:hypothetical protein [Bradyrhizobium sp. CCBAU 11361]|uniref:hypothetical protein n=1 Tax=Bradyrhizobium sp. CCBAU 11361 TaxID=1630812 RepID=UPI002305ACD8|nr:hypothetical protein [Bradyrhizobium sp. CCBAU 11361]MDA9492365.1 hypothetical protein [Bradyrhizobium sp. CCBAU 11361]